MPPVFGRNDSDPHPYDSLLDDLMIGREDERAVACNVRHDCRVSREREDRFDAFFKQRVAGQDLRNALRRYHKHRIRILEHPDFGVVELNGHNFRTGHPEHPNSLHKDILLARLVDLNGLEPVVRAHGATEAVFRRYREASGMDFGQWLDREIPEQGKRAMVAAILRSLNRSRRSVPFQPSWATYWARLKPYLDGPPHRWVEALGMPKESGRWIMVLRYPVRAAGKLVRPTVLDAADSPHHFPTPEASPTGHPVELGAERVGEPLLPELIHRQIDHDIDTHWEAAGGILERTSMSTDTDLVRQRRGHLEYLKSEYGSSVLDWRAV